MSILPEGLVDHPACTSVAAYLGRLAPYTTWPSVAELDALFADRLRLPDAVALESQPPGKKARGRDAIYEVRIHETRRIPTRPDSWHDLMNLLVWCAYPRSKRALSARQHANVTRQVPSDATKLPARRTREGDALAMLDEGGALLLVRPSSAHLALDRPDHVAREIREGHATLRLFGHALLEAVALGQLTEQRDLRSAVTVLHAEDDDAADTQLAARLSDPGAFQSPDAAQTLWLGPLLAARA